jgi:DeoR family transcriptional regulator, fructose operon transcriptional repressor
MHIFNSLDFKNILMYCYSMNKEKPINNNIEACPAERTEIILDLIYSRGFLSVRDVAQHLKVSEMTIRRDFDKLDAEGLIRRTYGGAVAEHRAQVDLDFKARQNRRREEKEKVGMLAATLLQSGQSVFLDAGTTVLAAVKYLKNIKNLQIISNSLPIYSELLSYNYPNLVLVGGQVLGLTLSLVGTLAQENISGMRFDWAFLGTAGIDINRGLTHSAMEEIPIKRAAAKSAKKIAVLADHSKLDYSALAFFMPTEQIDVIVTDQPCPQTQHNLEQLNFKTKIIWAS